MTVNTNKGDLFLRAANDGDALRLAVLATQVFLDTYAFAGITEEVANEVSDAFNPKAFAKLLIDSALKQYHAAYFTS